MTSKIYHVVCVFNSETLVMLTLEMTVEKAKVHGEVIKKLTDNKPIEKAVNIASRTRVTVIRNATECDVPYIVHHIFNRYHISNVQLIYTVKVVNASMNIGMGD